MTSSERAQHVAELVKSALEREPREWPSFLTEICGSDTELRAEIESLLEHQDGASQFIETPALHLAAESLVREGAFRAGQTIGDYKIISPIGSGGMGEVYLAEDRQLHRKVALKLVRRGMDSEHIVRHFKREEHLLASLNHPNISQLYGGGVSEDGIPFFAMEYVEGQRLDEYCDERGLGTKDRLQLFRKVCAAVTYAHQHLVIHRDLKPANIRVTAEGEPKLLDFGIAKLLDSENAQSSGQTLTLQGVMTPEYASPEQVRGETMTTASDIYSLGVVLYKLLTGQSPYRTKTNRPDEIARAITEQEPTRPSTAIARSTSDSINNQLSTIIHQRSLRGDLDNIILMALRKEPQRRYSSVGQFAADIERHLDGLPVIARKDTLAYRSSKFVRRHRVGVAAAALVMLSLIGGIIATVIQAHRAEKRFNDVRSLANSLVFEIMPKIRTAPGTKEARQIAVERALQYLDVLSRDAGNDASLKLELASAYRELGDAFDDGIREKLIALGESLLKTSPRDLHVRDEVARDYEQIAWNLWGHGDNAKSLDFYRKSLALRESLRAVDPQSFDFQFRLGHVEMSVGDFFSSDNNWDEALKHYRAALRAIEPLLQHKDEPANRLRLQRGFVYCRNGMANAFLGNGELDGASEEFNRALSVAEPMMANFASDTLACDLVVTSYSGQAKIDRKRGDYQSAQTKLRRAIQIVEPHSKADLGIDLASLYSDLGAVLNDIGQTKEALTYLGKAVPIQEEMLTNAAGAGSRDGLALTYERLAAVQQQLGDVAAAATSFERARRAREKHAQTENAH